MDPLSVIASSAAIFDALKSAYRFAEDYIHAGQEREDFKSQLTCVADLEWALNHCIENGKSDPDAAWLQPLDPRNANSPLAGLERTMTKMVKVLQMKESTFKQKLKDFRWHAEKKSMEEYFRAIHGYCQTISVRLSIGNILLSQSQMVLMKETHQMTKDMAANDERRREEDFRRREDAERKDVERWLSPLDFQARQREIFEVAAGTGGWFLDLPEFKAWKEEESLGELRCYGDTGTGKTVLSSIIVNHLTNVYSSISPTLCIYFEKTPSTPHSRNKILGSLLKQLIQLKDPGGISPGIYEAWKKATRLNAHATNHELEELFRAELQFYGRVYIIIDALDEASTDCRNYVKKDLKRLSPERLRLLTTTRVDEERSPSIIVCDICQQRPTLYYQCRDCPYKDRIDICPDCKGKGESCTRDPAHGFSLPYKLEVDIVASRDDLDMYVKTRIKEQMPPEEDVDPDMNSSHRMSTKLGRHCNNDPSLFNMIVSSIVDNSDGKFLLAKLYTNSLSNKVTKGDIKRAAREMENRQYNLSDTINRLYEEDLKNRIEGQMDVNRQLAIKILSLVYYARRNLTLQELNHALATRLGDTEYDSEQEMDEQEILSVTQGFITIGRDKDSIVRLGDGTLYEYFNETHDYWFRQGETEFANICLTYLGFDAFSKPCSAEWFAVKEQKHALLAYAVEHWGDHVQNAGDTEVNTRAASFLQNNFRLQAYIQAAWETNTHDQHKWDIRRDIHALHICAWFNLDKLLSVLGSAPLDINIQEKTYGQTPLMYACRRGNIEVARHLLVLGASVNISSERGRTALFEAVLQKNEQMVDLLLDFDLRGQDVDVNKRNTKLFNRTPLLQAVAQSTDGTTPERSIRIAHALLEHPNIAVNIEEAFGYTSLCLAAQRGLETVVDKLLSFPDIAVDVSDTEGGRSALIFAAEENRVDILTSLLDGGADLNLVDARGGTAALRATEGGNTEALRVLIDLNADFSCTDEDQRTLVHAAAEEGHIDILELLKEHPLEVNACDKYGMTPFHRACRAGQLEAGEYLLELGANTAIQDLFQRTPFVVAWQYGQRKLMDLCRDKGTNRAADTAQNIKAEELPVWSLVYLHRLDLVTEAKSSRESDFCTREPETDNTALHCALSTNDHLTASLLLELLLLSPAQDLLNTPNRFKETPLHLAAINNHIECTKLLLRHEPLLNEVDRFGRTPLTIAYVYQHLDIAIALVEVGANIRPDSRIDIQKMLFAAVEFQNIKAVDNLMKAGADRMAQDEYGRTVDMFAKRMGNGEILRVLQPHRSFMFKMKVEEQVKVVNTVRIVERETDGGSPEEEGEMTIPLMEVSYKVSRARNVQFES